LQDLPLFSDAVKNYTRNIKRLNVNWAAHLTEYLFKNELRVHGLVLAVTRIRVQQ